MKDSGSNENVLIVAPTGQDAQLAAEVLGKADIRSEILHNLEELTTRLQHPAGAVFMAEEALTPEGVEPLKKVLADQEAWSDLPILAMVSSGGRRPSGQRFLELFGPTASLSLIERPFHTVTLISTLRVLLRARRRQYQVRDLLSELRSSLQQRDEFVSMASHELKTPVTTLKLQNQIKRKALARGDTSFFTGEKIKRSVETTDRQISRLTALIEDLLDVSRIRTGKLALEKEEVDLSRLTEQLIEQVSPGLTSEVGSIEFHGTANATGFWDPHRVEQVVSNLISNAIKYGAGKPIHVSVTADEERATLLVRDQGGGISRENQERIFERFERAVTGSKVGGLGLGLYIVRQIVEQHGGNISVQSKLKQGSTFRVELPKK